VAQVGNGGGGDGGVREQPGVEPAPGPAPLPGRLAERLRRCGRWVGGHLKHVMVVGVVTAAVGGATPAVLGAVQSAWFEDPAPSCPGAGCTGKDSGKAGCFPDALRWERKADNPARLQARYSPRCGAVWGLMLSADPGDSVAVVVSGGGQQSKKVNYGHDQYSPMVAVGRAFHARVCAVPSALSSRTGVWPRYCVDFDQNTPWTD
jgi:Protein of unknown function (DUF2690)